MEFTSQNAFEMHGFRSEIFTFPNTIRLSSATAGTRDFLTGRVFLLSVLELSVSGGGGFDLADGLLGGDLLESDKTSLMGEAAVESASRFSRSENSSETIQEIKLWNLSYRH